MKVVWIILGIFLGLGILCCGGMFLFGKGVYNAVVETNDQADKFASKAMTEIGKDWSLATLKKYAAPEFKQIMNDDEITARLKGYAEKLGALKSCKEFTATTTSSNYDNGESVVTVHNNAQAIFEKGTGTLDVSVVKHGDQWGLIGFEIRSDALPK